jgi:hypothetical protein
VRDAAISLHHSAFLIPKSAFVTKTANPHYLPLQPPNKTFLRIVRISSDTGAAILVRADHVRRGKFLTKRWTRLPVAFIDRTPSVG